MQTAYDTIAAQTQCVQPLLLTIGADLWQIVLDRLVARGLIRRQKSRILGVFRTLTWPATDGRHEAQLRSRIHQVLVDGEAPDPRTAAVIALVYASGAMTSLRPPLPWTSTTVTRAQEIQLGSWGAEAVSTAVTRTAAAVVAAISAVAGARNHPGTLG